MVYITIIYDDGKGPEDIEGYCRLEIAVAALGLGLH
jgi:hypothetical protein